MNWPDPAINRTSTPVNIHIAIAPSFASLLEYARWRPLRLNVTRWSHLYKARNQTSSKRRCRHNISLDASGNCSSLNLYSPCIVVS